MQLNIPQCTGQPHKKNYPTPNVNSAKVERPCVDLKDPSVLLSTLSPTPSWEPGTKRGSQQAFTEYRWAKSSLFPASLPKSLLLHQQALSTVSTLHRTDHSLYLYVSDTTFELQIISNQKEVTFLLSLISLSYLYTEIDISMVLHLHS